MKVAIFNGSSMKDDAIGALTSSVKEMMIADGASVEEHFLYHLGIKGCLTCGPRGSCRDDALRSMVDEFLASDAVIFASPIIMGRLADPINGFTDVLNSEARFNDSAAERMSGKRVAAAIVVGGDERQAQSGIDYVKFFCGSAGAEYRGSIVIPHADAEKIAGPACREQIREFVRSI
jgi:multimeric flavodoxin WrbA